MQNQNNFLIINCDGGARGNPGPAAIGVVIKNSQKKTIIKYGKPIGSTTNNIAEYSAVVEAFFLIRKFQLTPQKILFYLDSLLVTRQLQRRYKIKEIHLKNLFLKVKKLEQEMNGQINYNVIPREKNYDADEILNRARDANNEILITTF